MNADTMARSGVQKSLSSRNEFRGIVHAADTLAKYLNKDSFTASFSRFEESFMESSSAFCAVDNLQRSLRTFNLQSINNGTFYLILLLHLLILYVFILFSINYLHYHKISLHLAPRIVADNVSHIVKLW